MCICCMKWDSPSKSKTQNKTFSTQCFFSGKTTEHDTEYWVGKKVGVIKSFSDKTWGIADIWYPAVLSGAPKPIRAIFKQAAVMATTF